MNKLFKDKVNIIFTNSIHSLKLSSRKVSSRNKIISRSIQTVALTVLFVSSGCATIQEKAAYVADALKADVQTQHDENFRMKRIRKALSSGDIQAAEQHRDTLYALHWKCVANLEIAAQRYPKDSDLSLEIAREVTKEIWGISDANRRAIALLSLLKFELETKKDIPSAKETIKQTEKTIAFILDDHARKMRRYGELQMLLEKHNHLLSR